jgi:hypothetical protein
MPHYHVVSTPFLENRESLVAYSDAEGARRCVRDACIELQRDGWTISPEWGFVTTERGTEGKLATRYERRGLLRRRVTRASVTWEIERCDDVDCSLREVE